MRSSFVHQAGFEHPPPKEINLLLLSEWTFLRRSETAVGLFLLRGLDHPNHLSVDRKLVILVDVDGGKVVC